MDFWNKSLPPCCHCSDAPIDIGNTLYDPYLKSWLISGPGNHRRKHCPAIPVLTAGWQPPMEPCRRCQDAPIDAGNTYHDARSNSWLQCGPGNHLGKNCTKPRVRPNGHQRFSINRSSRATSTSTTGSCIAKQPRRSGTSGQKTQESSNLTNNSSISAQRTQPTMPDISSSGSLPFSSK